jgi:hypothetical protein
LLFCALKYKIFDRNGVVPELAMYTTGLENLLINFFFGGGGNYCTVLYGIFFRKTLFILNSVTQQVHFQHPPWRHKRTEIIIRGVERLEHEVKCS